MSLSKDEQLAALKDLLWWLSHRDPVRKFFREEGAGASAKPCLAEVTGGCLKLQFSQRMAEKRLLASGYPVPDHWLRLHTGQVDHKWKRGVGDTISIIDVDVAGLERAANEISLAILRLENEPGPAATHSTDFTTVNWFGTEYHFALGVQSAAVKALWEEWNTTGLGLHQGTICKTVDAERDTFRMDKAFRDNPAFGTMIQRIGDGKYKLVEPLEGPCKPPTKKKSARIPAKARRKPR
jgi:hypothetical protein